MTRAGIHVLLCLGLMGSAELGVIRPAAPAANAVVDRIMATALSRCYSKVNGVTRIAFEPPTSEELAQIKALGEGAVAPLARYIELVPKNGLTQLLAVKFLITVGARSTLGPLEKAFDQDQWEVTRAQALSGIFGISQVEAKPYVHAGLSDRSSLVRRRAQALFQLYR
jgi:hypothetical protein